MIGARLSRVWVVRYEWAAALGLGLTILGITLTSRLSADVMADFRAFWCGGVVLVHHANPYLQQPLQRCEQHAGPPWEGASLRLAG
ncbi:hypothetical protein WPS_22790 [Vulcanimicrobium alpinum]|uniref:Uncharacterized protein n=1 Tax=Vulcanimicrobium alpinum TaxID=3016050 RepID=A0AAN2CAJ5_UNVUL|nr:hypothetical protein [Vulcanimicrobium alpinum]BDE07003.1 hypothetical protein WPS_22790 [Vulcanimicrobium alpinum]